MECEDHGGLPRRGGADRAHCAPAIRWSALSFFRLFSSITDGKVLQERSLTTMTYLIALLELSQVPFSMVDEINQGMDGRAERAIHDTLVAAVCNRSDMGQCVSTAVRRMGRKVADACTLHRYFLLTPKLLTGLTYAENMKILVVNNGDWLPDYLPLRSILKSRLEAKRKK